MASPKSVSLGFLVLICLTLSSAHRVLLDDKMPKHSTLAGGGGGGGGGGGSGSGSGSGSGYGSGSGSGSGGSNSGGGSGGGGGCGGSGDSGWPPSGGYYPPPTGPYYPPPAPGFEPQPGFGCPNNPGFGFGPGFGCVCGIVPGGVPGGTPGDGVLHGWGSGAQNRPVSYWAEKRDQGAAHEAHSGHGPFQFNEEDGEPVPPDDSAPIMADEEMEDHHKINNMNHKMAEPSHH